MEGGITHNTVDSVKPRLSVKKLEVGSPCNAELLTNELLHLMIDSAEYIIKKLSDQRIIHSSSMLHFYHLAL